MLFAVIVISLVAVTTAQPPAAAIVLVTVYIPGVLADKLISPEAAFTNTKPAEDEKTPAPPPPLNVGKGLIALAQ